MPNTATTLSPVIFAVATSPERNVLERSNIISHDATLLQTGIGPGPVRSVADAIMTRKPAGLISIGTAGGLNTQLQPGHLLLPSCVTTDTGEVFPVTSAWHARVHQRLTDHDIEIENSAIVSVVRAVRLPGDKRQLAENTGAVAVDMESAELARIAARLSIPFLILRTIADPVDQSLPLSAIAALTSHGELHIAGLLRQLLRRPGEIAGLIRLNSNFRAACRKLDTCCRVAGEEMCTPNR